VVPGSRSLLILFVYSIIFLGEDGGLEGVKIIIDCKL
jgi:hypothetical protein